MRKKDYNSYDKNVVDTLIVERDGEGVIERYKGQNLDEYEYSAEMNHDYLLSFKFNVSGNDYKYAPYMRNVTLDDIFEYLKKNFNWKGGEND